MIYKCTQLVKSSKQFNQANYVKKNCRQALFAKRFVLKSTGWFDHMGRFAGTDAAKICNEKLVDFTVDHPADFYMVAPDFAKHLDKVGERVNSFMGVMLWVRYAGNMKERDANELYNKTMLVI